MTSDLAGRDLARLAARLNRPRHLPPVILMTDESRLPDPIAAAVNLPRGSAVIIRERDPGRRASLAHVLRRVARGKSLMLLVSEDAGLAKIIGAAGIHLPEKRLREAAHWRALRPDWIITAAAHNAAALAAAIRAGADAVLLAPVFATLSHPERKGIGAMRAAQTASLSPV